MRPLLVVGLLICAGCGEVTPPLQPTATAPRTFTVSGSVVDTAHRYVSGARVEVVDGPLAGTVAMSDERGRFLMPAKLPEPVNFRVTKDGFVSATRTWPTPGRPPPRGEGVDFWIELSSPGTPIDLTGTYTLTLTADSACTGLPGETRTRTYTATILPLVKPTDFRVSISGGQFFRFYSEFGIQTAGTFVRFDVYRWIDEVEPGIVEQTHEQMFLAITGIAPMSVGAEGLTAITVPFEGTLEYCPSQPDGDVYRCADSARVTCFSGNHRLTAARR